MTIEKTIYFGLLDWRKNNTTVFADSVFSLINQFDFESGARYYDTSQGAKLGVIIKNLTYPIRGIIGDSRRFNLQFLEKYGDLSPLNVEENTGIFDAMHFVIMKNARGKDVIIYEYNPYAPRVSSLNHYIMAKCKSLVDYCITEPIVAGTVEDVMGNFSSLKRMSLKVHRATTISDLSAPLGDALSALATEHNGAYIEISINMGHHKEPLSGNLISNIVPFFKRGNPQEVLESFYVSGVDRSSGKTEEYNLLELFMKVRKSVARIDDDHRFVDSDKMFLALEEAYSDRRLQLDAL